MALESAVLGAETRPVLVASPDADDCREIARLTNSGNWKLTHSPTWLETRNHLIVDRIPIVIAAQQMTGASWKDLADLARQLPHQPRVLVITRFCECPRWNSFIEAGAFDVVAKPFEATELKQVLEFAWLAGLESQVEPPSEDVTEIDAALQNESRLGPARDFARRRAANCTAKPAAYRATAGRIH